MRSTPAQQRWYEQNKGRHVASVSRYKLRLRWFISIYKEQPCADCKRSFPSVAMDFDHRPGKRKLFTIAIAPVMGFSIKKVLSEIAKCDVVCSNCHRVRTIKRRVKEVTRPPKTLKVRL